MERRERAASPDRPAARRARVRLSSLGDDQGASVEVVDERLADVIGRFQADRGLRFTRRLDAKTVIIRAGAVMLTSGRCAS